jgi:sialate O-acetylesterase
MSFFPRFLVKSVRIAATFTALCLFQIAHADVKLASPFTDHMVLQSDMPVPVWGQAEPGEKVTVRFAEQTVSGSADKDGKWMIRLSDLKASAEPADLIVEGKNSITCNDVLVGEVWLASGQSNMVFTVSKKAASFAGLVDEAEVIAAADDPTIRMFTARDTKTYEPQSSAGGKWAVCSPQTVPAFSAIGYLFARDLQKELHVPVGILTVASGASCAEAWISREALAADKDIKFMLDSLDESERYFRATPQGPPAEAPVRPTPINKPRTLVTRLTDPSRDQHFATVCFNGMLNPVIPYAIRGALWYQGESICWGMRGLNLYGHVQKTMIQDWRARWGEGNFPFYLVQLPGQLDISNNPRIREEQSSVLSMPKTGMAVAIDVGEAKNVHPRNKEPVADRLARLARANVYSQKVECNSPTFESMKIEGAVARVKFSNTAGGLSAKDGGALKGFQIAAHDQEFVDAEAKVDGDNVLVSASKVTMPVAVRYAWNNYPEGMGCNLQNSAGLPAAPFRTDHWDYTIPGLVEH